MKTIGIMTGNSLDAVDTVITEFSDNVIHDICGHTLPIPPDIATEFRELKTKIKENNGCVSGLNVTELHDKYIKLVAQAVHELLKKANLKPQDIEIIGFHGQTCAHFPPSVASGKKSYTAQLGSGQMLADLTGIPVAFDFRSDDILNGGEGAPLAPIHNLHIAHDLKAKKIFPLAFCNAGNTGNIAIISEDIETKQEKVIGFDVGPCNHFVDMLARTVKNQACDFDGKFGIRGKVNKNLLKDLYDNCAKTEKGDNFLTLTPPKSSDPQWYEVVDELRNKDISFEDKIRTVEYFSAWLFVDALKFIPQNIRIPEHFLLFGGGWQNPVILEEFKKLLGKNKKVEWSDQYGYSGKYMEARIFADMAKCKLMNEPFTFPETTGCKTPTVCGIIAKPGGNNSQLWSRASKI